MVEPGPAGKDESKDDEQNQPSSQSRVPLRELATGALDLLAAQLVAVGEYLVLLGSDRRNHGCTGGIVYDTIWIDVGGEKERDDISEESV
jgi:hypothetical protein